jgi:nitric oxide reductase large subunit
VFQGEETHAFPFFSTHAALGEAAALFVRILCAASHDRRTTRTPQYRAARAATLNTATEPCFCALSNRVLDRLHTLEDHVAQNGYRKNIVSVAALMGVFGMLAIALMVFVLRQTSDDARWARIEK